VKDEVGKKRKRREVIDEDEDAEDDEYSRLSRQQWRFFTHDTNPTTKCKNCREFGHKARDCPNETYRQSCILCGQDTHDSFSCDAKTCFKCNKVGHEARNCNEKNIVKCRLCGLNGHKDYRCLKIWDPLSSKDTHLWN
jgi:hypothetical protein